MTPESLAAFRAHSEAESPREACGVLVVQHGREVFRACRNLHPEPTLGFRIAASELVDAEDQGLIAILHSHPNGPSSPSMADRVGCENNAVPYVILGLPAGDITTLEPSGYQAPLIGRPYVFGLMDCWNLIRDYYRQELGITLPDFPREDNFWLRGENLYLNNAEAAGFVRVDEASAREHDVILMAISGGVPDHGAVYLGGQMILHHRPKRLSGRDVYGGMWMKATTHVFRHRSLL